MPFPGEDDHDFSDEYEETEMSTREGKNCVQQHEQGICMQNLLNTSN